MESDFNPLDLIDSGETFNPQSWEHWVLIVLFVAFAIGGYIWVNNQSKRPKNYRYNRETGNVELDED